MDFSKIIEVFLGILLYETIKCILKFISKIKFRIWETLKEMCDGYRLQGFFVMFGIPTIYSFCLVSKRVALICFIFGLFVYFLMVRLSLNLK